MNRPFSMLVKISALAAFIMLIAPAAAYLFLTAAGLNAQQSSEAPAAVEPLKVLKLGRIPYLDPRKMVRSYESMMEYLKKELQLNEVRLVLTPDYNTLTQFLKEGKVDVAWHGVFAYPKAREMTGARAILTPVWSGKKSYCGIIVARADSNINSLADLKGKSFAFTDKKSASGYFLPTIFLLENNIDPEKDFSRVEYIKKHDNILYNVLYKKFDAGAVYDNSFQLLKNDEERNQLKIVSKTADILNEPIMVRKDLPDELSAKIKAAFLKLSSSDPATKHILSDIGNLDGFTESCDADYDGVVQMVEKYKSIFEERTGEVLIKNADDSLETGLKK
jgi:phosphate/phosphite/phosphonate ABC transporter binding protein